MVGSRSGLNILILNTSRIKIFLINNIVLTATIILTFISRCYFRTKVNDEFSLVGSVSGLFLEGRIRILDISSRNPDYYLFVEKGWKGWCAISFHTCKTMIFNCLELSFADKDPSASYFEGRGVGLGS